ncbi:hypothetical protein [Natrarchaeobaculum aegyptiacum]|uniref:Uncharacterized protein n=1 Tax=Natrarchaeobaculum aegyptiacum TaxID=745377 RepID=A0A2Z2HW03_9EURY|nr:hypothetical protein [Natrarchaeobaculum aegyptiacum]ARS91402.1 hypothetical protein B1756_17870 [Natrarchaeobaculum aegyptiacum]
MKEGDLDENPSLIPFFGIGLTLTIFSVWIFVRAISGGIVSQMVEYAGEGETDMFVLQGFLDVLHGQMAFSALGLIILIIASIKYFEKWNGIHVLMTIVISFVIIYIGSSYDDISIVVWAFILFVLADTLFCWTYWPVLRDRAREIHLSALRTDE